MFNEYFTKEDFNQMCDLLDRCFLNIQKEYAHISRNYYDKRTTMFRLNKVEEHVYGNRDNKEYMDYRNSLSSKQDYRENVYTPFRLFLNKLDEIKRGLEDETH